MSADTTISDADLLADPALLRHWFDERLGDTQGLRLSLVHGGRSNSLFRAERGDSVFAIRRPPPIATDKTSHNLHRELRLLSALKNTDVPHARLLGGCLDESPIGGPFIVVEWVEGFCPRDPMPDAFGHDAVLRRTLGEQVIDALAQVATADWRGIGLVDFGKPEGFLQRQVDRWLAQYDRAATRELANLHETADWLRTHTPTAGPTALIHGDFSFANVLVRPDVQPRVCIIDWELATIGDPLLDLGHLLSSWEDPSSGPTWAHYIDWHRGFCSRAEAADRYARATGFDVSHLQFYIVLALFRLAVILEGAYALWLQGRASHPHHGTYAERVPAILAQASREIPGA